MDYRKTAKEYAEQYGRNERTIKRWKAKAWPLDDENATRLLMEAGGVSEMPDGDAAPFRQRHWPRRPGN